LRHAVQYPASAGDPDGISTSNDRPKFREESILGDAH
jgi:hypothetical protein